jgi:protoporphyrinogen/coproporphyrinogen III oxidase
VTLDDGTRHEAGSVAVATTPGVAAKLIAGAAPAASAALDGVGERAVHSVGVVVPKDKVTLPYATFFIPTGDLFHSIVTRDVVDHPRWRGFVFHFKPGLDPEKERARIGAVLGLPAAEIAMVKERTSVLPSPARGHHERMRALDAALAGTRLAVTGNYFAGLAIEDCVQRSRGEWRRVAQVS